MHATRWLTDPRTPPESAMSEKPITAVIADLRAAPVPDLVARYEEVFGKPPRVKHRDWLWRRIAWKVQEQRFGGLSEVAKRRLDELIAEIDLPLCVGHTAHGRLNGHTKPGDAVVGTTLVRAWRGVEIRTTRTEQGWECGGVVYGSLSAVAKAVSGSHVSGPAWFGVTKRRGATT